MKRPIKRVLVVVALALFAVAAYIGCGIWRVAFRGIPEAYAAWDCASLVVEYMDTHNGTWPKSWAEVFSAAHTLPRDDRALRGHSTNTLDKIRKLVRVDWNADARELATAKREGDTIPFRVITRADGSDFPTVWSGAEPNTLVWEYLRDRTGNHTSGGIRQPADGLPEPSM